MSCRSFVRCKSEHTCKLLFFCFMDTHIDIVFFCWVCFSGNFQYLFTLIVMRKKTLFLITIMVTQYGKHEITRSFHVFA